MKHLRLFEINSKKYPKWGDINVGDYVILKEYRGYYNIITRVVQVYGGGYYSIEFLQNQRELGLTLQIMADMIIFWSKDLEECKYYIETEKYNL